MALTLLGREHCGLCEDFLEAFAAEFPKQFKLLTIADVDSRPGWQGRFGLVIPVLLDDEGTVICETRFDADAVAAALGSTDSRPVR